MKISFSVKQLGKKRPVIGRKSIEIKGLGADPRADELISAIVTQQVAQFNENRDEKNIIPYLTKSQINDSAISGKVDFNESSNRTTAVPETAIETALLAFEDGIFCFFCDDTQIEALSERVSFTEESLFSFVRLTFLAGSMW